MSKVEKFRNPKVRKILSLGILIFLVFLAGCGKNKTAVRPPAAPPAPSAQKPPSEKPQGPAAKAKGTPADASAQAPAVEVPASEKEEPHPLVSAASGPIIRIGLTTSAREVRISSAGRFYLMEKEPEATRKLLEGEVRVRTEDKDGGTAAVFQIQVASFIKRGNAESIQKRLSKEIPEPVAIHRNPSTGTHQVRAGAFAERKQAESLLRKLWRSGYPDAYVVMQQKSSGGGKSMLAIRGSGNLFHLSEAGVLFQPASNSSFLCVDGKPYRGFLDIILNGKGRITVVNHVAMEDYLLGVVPAEINPSAYPEFDGLAAMSIAARTYALYHLGRYKSEGFDLSNDTRTQVYKGVEAEIPATTEAVQRTRGLAVYYEGKVINAMYTSTCGGRTEDFANVFDTDPVPYLKSVFCAVEAGAENNAVIVEGNHGLRQIITAEDGTIANRNLHLARVLGLTDANSELSPEYCSAPAERKEAVRWIESARKLVPRRFKNEAAPDLSTRAGFLLFAAESLFGAEEIRRKVSGKDVEYYLGNLADGSAVPESARYALAYLMKHGLWRPCADNTARPEAPVRRCDALALLAHWIESVRPEVLNRGTFVAGSLKAGGDSAATVMTVKWGRRTREFAVSDDAALFRLDSGRATPVRRLGMIGNEKIAFHVRESGAIDFLETELSPTGASSDRYSPAAKWEVRITRADLEKKLRPLAPSIGRLLDLKPARLGNSGRVVQIEAIGSSGSAVLNGYRFRGAAGLMDTLYTIKRECNPDGGIEAFIFDGRGFGHGVGLCQVGAFGMARAGKSYEEILKTYYTGVEIRKAY